MHIQDHPSTAWCTLGSVVYVKLFIQSYIFINIVITS